MIQLDFREDQTVVLPLEHVDLPGEIAGRQFMARFFNDRSLRQLEQLVRVLLRYWIFELTAPNALARRF